MNSKGISLSYAAAMLILVAQTFGTAVEAQDCSWACAYGASMDPESIYCQKGECLCRNSTLAFDEPTYTCKLRVGQPCSSGHECINGVCLNPTDHSSEEGKTCYNTLGNHCNRNHECTSGEFLTCLNSVCRCQDLVNHVEEDGRCVLRTFSTGCSNGTSSPACGIGAECNSASDTCVCSSDSILLDGVCQSKVCNSHSECYRFALECRDGICGCPTATMSYDEARKYCYLPIGARCDLTPTSTAVPMSTYRSDYCFTPEAKCDWEQSGNFKVCRCDDDAGYVQSVDPVTGEKNCVQK